MKTEVVIIFRSNDLGNYYFETLQMRSVCDFVDWTLDLDWIWLHVGFLNIRIDRCVTCITHIFTYVYELGLTIYRFHIDCYM